MMDEIDEQQHERHMGYFDRAREIGDKKKSPANLLSTQITRYVRELGGYARRVNTMGIFDEKKMKWRPSGMKRGFEDLDVIIPLHINGVKVGLKIAVEIKIGKDKQSDEQKERMREVNECGGIYLICKDIESARVDIYESVLKKVKEIEKPRY